MIQMSEKASEQKKKKLHFCRSKMASHARPQRLLHVTVGFQRTHETSPRCGGATVPPCNHSGCPTTPSKAILKHMTTPYGTLYQISNFPREQNSLILNRPRVLPGIKVLLKVQRFPPTIFNSAHLDPAPAAMPP